jgi:hypothetical protein
MTAVHLAGAVGAALAIPTQRLELVKQAGKGHRKRWVSLDCRDPKSKLKLVDFSVVGVKDTADDAAGLHLFSDTDKAPPGLGAGSRQQVIPQRVALLLLGSTRCAAIIMRLAVRGQAPKKSRRTISPEGVRIRRYGEGASMVQSPPTLP